MSTEYRYKCDGCGKDITETVSVGIETQEYDRRPAPADDRHIYRYSARIVWDLCEDCVKDVVAALKKSVGNGVAE